MSDLKTHHTYHHLDYSNALSCLCNSVGSRDFQVLKLFSVLDGKPVLYSLEILLKEGYFWKILIHRVS